MSEAPPLPSPFQDETRDELCARYLAAYKELSAFLWDQIHKCTDQLFKLGALSLGLTGGVVTALAKFDGSPPQRAGLVIGSLAFAALFIRTELLVLQNIDGLASSARNIKQAADRDVAGGIPQSHLTTSTPLGFPEMETTTLRMIFWGKWLICSTIPLTWIGGTKLHTWCTIGAAVLGVASAVELYRASEPPDGSVLLVSGGFRPEWTEKIRRRSKRGFALLGAGFILQCVGALAGA